MLESGTITVFKTHLGRHFNRHDVDFMKVNGISEVGKVGQCGCDGLKGLFLSGA